MASSNFESQISEKPTIEFFPNPSIFDSLSNFGTISGVNISNQKTYLEHKENSKVTLNSPSSFRIILQSQDEEKIEVPGLNFSSQLFRPSNSEVIFYFILLYFVIY